LSTCLLVTIKAEVSKHALTDKIDIYKIKIILLIKY